MGALLCLLSAAFFGAMAVFGKLAYAAGVGVDALLLVRFGVAAVLLLAVAAGRGALRGLTARTVVLGGAAAAGFDWLGALLALGAAVTYTGYILVGDRLTGAVPLGLAALVCTGATGTFLLAGVVRGAPTWVSPRWVGCGWRRWRWSARWARSCCSSPGWPGWGPRSRPSCPC